MIKREKSTSCSSIVIDNSKTVYDTKRTKTVSFRIFGVKIYSWSESFDCDKFEGIVSNDKKVGF